MMTWEEAIELLNEQYETCKRIYDCSADQRKSYPNVPQFMEALGMALTALRPVSREQVERMRGEWNYSHKTKIDGFDVVQCSKCGQEALTLALYVKNGNFCPACGATMTDEAVEIVVERLEALKDG